VFAVPGTVTSRQSRGCHALIKSGRAKLTETVDDILEEIVTRKIRRPAKGRAGGIQAEPPNLNLFERKIYDAMEAEPLHIDVISGRTGMSAADVLVHILGLEFKNCARQLPGKLFIRL